MSTSTSPYLMRFEPRPLARARLLCFPHAGGGASAFATWHRVLPRDLEVFAVQLPGREGRRREPPVTDMNQLMLELSRQLRDLHDRPLALFGHSLGALCAFEYARAMRRAGAAAPLQLFVSAAWAPQRPASKPVSDLPQSDLVREMIRRYDGIPKVVLDDPELLDYFMTVLRIDLKLLESYRYVAEPPLDCPLRAFGGTEDARIPRSELELWSAQTISSFGCELYPGGHFYLTTSREALLASLVDALKLPPA